MFFSLSLSLFFSFLNGLLSHYLPPKNCHIYMSISLALRVTHNAASHVSSPRVEIVRSARRHKRRIQVTVLWQPAECEWWFHPLG